MSSSFAYQFRCILIGDTGVGKSCILQRFVEKHFHGDYEATIGVDCGYRTITTTDNLPIKLQIWDTAGHERFRSIAISYYRMAVGVLLVYDVTRRETFYHLESWLRDAKLYGDPNMAVMLIGNKCDLSRKRVVDTEEGERFAREHGLLFMEVSAKSALNVDATFSEIAVAIYKKVHDGVFDFSDEFSCKGIRFGYGRIPRTSKDDFVIPSSQHGGCNCG